MCVYNKDREFVVYVTSYVKKANTPFELLYNLHLAVQLWSEHQRPLINQSTGI